MFWNPKYGISHCFVHIAQQHFSAPCTLPRYGDPNLGVTALWTLPIYKYPNYISLFCVQIPQLLITALGTLLCIDNPTTFLCSVYTSCVKIPQLLVTVLCTIPVCRYLNYISRLCAHFTCINTQYQVNSPCMLPEDRYPNHISMLCVHFPCIEMPATFQCSVHTSCV